MADKHLSSQFDEQLNRITTMVMEMGGNVEAQLRLAVHTLVHMDVAEINAVKTLEGRTNHLELSIDHEISSIIGRRQPTARDLRLLVGISKITANLERAGDEALRIARMVESIRHAGKSPALPTNDLQLATDLAMRLLQASLDAFTRLDVETALRIIRDDDQIDEEYNGFLRKLITYMMEDPRTISPSLDLLFAAKAIERIGDHAKNIAESVIYIVKGTDVRHTTLAEREQALK